jgi:photosystem II stability/assembly factor-like uncharacterized protein
MFSVYFINANTGWSVGGPSSPKIIKTTNGGENWFNQSTTGISTPLYSVMFADANTGWAVAGYIGGETIVKTTNGGTNWFNQTSGDTRYLRDCFVKNSSTMIAVGQGGKIISTTNGGNNWTIHSTGSSIELWSVDFPNDTIGYAIGSTAVLKTTNGGVTFFSKQSNNLSDKFILYQNYPNPFNDKSKIKYQISKTGIKNNISKVKLILFDISGKKIETLVNRKQIPGIYEVIFDASKYSSGVYFYKLETESHSEIKKMVLLK